ncbi:MAG: Hsp20/alpha crystallin family protein [Armatimonadetes bacterium]|nr:Hsp20/alpha crystallin family protein [Armatimonadota bacterium]
MLRPTWDPFVDMLTLRDQVNRLFEESAARTPVRERREGIAQRVWSPPVDISEDKDEITLAVDLPGVSQSDIDIQLEGETLIIRGERTLPDQGEATCVRAERLSGPFMRTFTVATPVEGDKVSASYRDGVLMVSIPKAEETKPRRIAITAGDGK